MLGRLTLAALLLLAPMGAWAAKNKSGPRRGAPRPVLRVDQRLAADVDADPNWPPLSGPQPCPHWVYFRNEAGVPLQLQVGPQPRRQVAAGRTAAACIPADRVDWDVVAPAGWRYGGIAPLTGLAARTIVLDAPGGTLEVVNRSGDGQRLWLDDRDVGLLPPGELRRFGPLPQGHHRLLAQGQHGREYRPLQPSLRAGETAIETLLPASTVAVLRNPWPERVGVRIDGVDWGELAARGEWRVLGLSVGGHEARLIGRQTGQQRTVPLLAASSETPEGSATVEVAVSNRTGEDLDIPPALADVAGQTLASTANAVWRLPRGRFGVVLRGRDSGLAYRLDIRGKLAPVRQEWTIERPTARLRVVDGTGEGVHVAVGALPSFRLGARGQRDLVVPAGRLALVADSPDGARRLHAGLDLQPGRTAIWTARAALTALILRNDDREPIAVQLDGQTRGQIAAGQERRFELGAGRCHLRVLGVHSGLRAEGEVQVRDGDLTTVAFWPPDAAVRTEAAGTPLAVTARALALGTVQPGEAAALPAMPGRLTVEVREGDRVEVWRGTLTPTQQADVARPALPVVTLEAAWQGQALAAQVAIDDGPSQPLTATRPVRWSGLTPGEHTLTVRVGQLEYRRRVFVDGHAPLRRVRLTQRGDG